jgi:hypothetical protein
MNKRHALNQTDELLSPLNFYPSHVQQTSREKNPVKNTMLVPRGGRVNTRGRAEGLNLRAKDILSAEAVALAKSSE